MEPLGAEVGSSASAGGEGDTLVVAISSRAPFDLGESHELFERKGVDAFARHQMAREDAGKEGTEELFV